MNGNYKDTLKRLRLNMRNASESLDFEKAAELRDSINGLNKLKKKQKRLRSNLHIQDCYLFFRAYNESRYTIFFINNGLTQKRIDFSDLIKPDSDIIKQFISSNKYDIGANDNGKFLTSCLLEVSADKLYIEMPSGYDDNQVIKKLISSYNEFITT
jgi:excinuclease UvrABC nuclease subunit